MPDVVTIENSGIVTVIQTADTVTVVSDSTAVTVVDDASVVTILENSEIVTVIDGTATVTTVSVVSANGFAGSVENETTAPEITMSTTVTGIIKGDGTAISAATAGTDYVIPSGSITGSAASLSATLAVASGGTGVTTSTGSGSNVLSTSPTLVTPVLGAATATTVNKLTLTQPATGATLTIANGATLTASATASVSGTNTGDNAVNSLYSALISDKTVVLTNGTGITITGTYPNFTINSSITQYTDTDARKALSAGTGISYDNATGIITNDDPDQTVSLTGGTDISVTGTYPDFTIDFDGSTSYLPLSGGTLTGSITSFGTTHDTEVSGDFFGVQLSADHTQGTMVNFDGLDTYDGANHMFVNPTGLTFPDTTVQTTAYTGGAGVSSLTAGTGISLDVTTGDITVTNSEPDQTVTLTNGAGISITGTYPSFTIDCDITQYADADARLALSAGTGISYDNATGIITNDEPDQTVTLSDGTGITITGTYPSFTIDCDITQYTDTDARLALSAGTAISYDDTTGIITNDEPDQTVTLTNGTDISVTGTYPDFTISYSGTGGSGTVTTASVVSANGFAGTVATDTTTPAITISTSITGLLKGDGTAISAATSGTDYVVPSGSITGNAATVTTNANLTGVITSVGNATSIASQTGTGTKFVMDTSPTLVTPTIGAATATTINKITITQPATSGTLTIQQGFTLTADGNATVSGTNTGDNATNTLYSGLVSNATHTGDATGATALTVVAINGTLMSGLATGILRNTTSTGVPSIAVAADFPTLNQDTTGKSATVTTNANLTGPITSVGNATSIASQTGTGTKFVMDTSPTLITPILGTPTSGTLTNCTFPTLNQNTTGNAATVTTNANLTGVITSVGNATSIASQTGTGSKFVVDTSPTLVTPTIGAATATSINKVSVTAPATSATLTIADGATLTASATASVSGTNTGDNATNTNYSGLVSNATHTGDATGSTALTVVKINGVLMSGLATGILKNTTSTGVPSIATAGTDYVAPSGALGTPTSGTLTNCTFPTLNQNTTGNAATVTTNANLTGVITSVGNATSIASQTGTGSKFVMDTSPTLVTPVLGTPTSGTLTNCTFPTLNQNTSGSAASLSATLAVASGGTGQITATAAFNALAPSQTSNSGKYLKTDGTNTSWATLPSALPVLLFGGATTTNVAISNGSLPVLLFGGVTTINVTVT